MANNRKQPSAASAKPIAKPSSQSGGHQPSAFIVAARIVVVTVFLWWMLSAFLPFSLLPNSDSKHQHNPVVVVHDVNAPKVLPDSISSLLDRVDRNMQQQSPESLAQTLSWLSVALFDVNQAFEGEDPQLYQAKDDVKRLVATIEQLTKFITKGESAILFPSLEGSDLPSRPTSVGHWELATATVFAQGVTLADYYRIVESDDRHSGALVSAMRTLERITTAGDGLERMDFAGAAEKMTTSDNNDDEGSEDLLKRHSMYRLFATSSMSSAAQCLRRRTSMWEELIAIHPTFAPLRLHYIAAVLFDLEGDTIGSSGQSRYAIVGELVDREKQAAAEGKRRGADAAHSSVLDILKLHAAAALQQQMSANSATTSATPQSSSRSSVAEAVVSGFKAFQRLLSLGVLHGAAATAEGSNVCEDLLATPWMVNVDETIVVGGGAQSSKQKKSPSAATLADTWQGLVKGEDRPELLRKSAVASVRQVSAAAILQHVGDGAKAALDRCLF